VWFHSVSFWRSNGYNKIGGFLPDPIKKEWRERGLPTIAVITDIHGNYPALKAVLQDIDSNPDIEHIKYR
jgi:hypothetical protein